MMKCEPLATVANATARYHPHGDSLKAQTFPASCTRCQAQDACLVGQKRQDEECLKQYSIEGKKACVTLKVTTIASAVKTATESYTATAKANAQEHVTKNGKVKANANAKATATATESAEASADAEATKNAKATASGKATEKATA